MNGCDDDVPFTNTPSPYEVGLFLCGAAIRAMSAHWSSHPAHARELYGWYLRKIAFLDAGDTAVEQVVELLRQRMREGADERHSGGGAAWRVGDEVSFGAALRAALPPWVSDHDEEAAHSFTGDRPIMGSDPGLSSAGWDDMGAGVGLLFDAERGAWVPERTPAPHTRPFSLPCDDGFAIVLEFLSVCHSLAGATTAPDPSGEPEVLATECAVAMIEVLEQHQALSSEEPVCFSSRGPRTADTATLDLCFAMDEEMSDDAVMCVGSATRSFHALMSISWACASFGHQAALAAGVSAWVTALVRLLEAPAALGELLHACEALSRDDRGSDTDGTDGARALPHSVEDRAGERDEAVVSLTGAYRLLRQVFEGHLGEEDEEAGAAEDRVALAKEKDVGRPPTLQPTARGRRRPGVKLQDFFSSSRSVYLADNYVARLLALRGPTGSTGIPPRELHNRGTQPILQSIAAGTLLCVQLHLSLRSLAIAQQCANMALLASHQLHSPHALALAHYTNFVVQATRGRLLAAADSIAIALQLATSPAAAQAALSRDDPTVRTSSLCYAGAAELLLFYPGAVNPSLRALLTSDRAAHGGYRLALGVPHASDGADPAEKTEAEEPTGGGPATHTGSSSSSHTVLVQTIAQTARNALWLAEASAFLPPHKEERAASPPAVPSRWADVAASLTRQTLLTVGTLYGITASPPTMDEAALAAVLAAVDADALVHPPLRSGSSISPRLVLLTEATRLTAHRVLAVLDGRLVSPPETGGDAGVARTPAHDHCSAALRTASRFLDAVRHHYGPDGLAAVHRSVFLTTAVQLAALCSLSRRGYSAAAYDGLSGLALRLYRISGASPAAAARSHASSFDAALAEGAVGGVGVTAVDVEEARVLTFLRASAAVAAAAASPALSSVTADSVRGGAPRSSTVTSAELYWPPDHLLLFACVQVRRAELALHLGYVEAISVMEAILRAISARCCFVYGVLCSNYMGLLGLQARRNHSGLVTAADALLASAQNVGLTALTVPVLARKVAALSAAGQWPAALAALDRVAPHVREEDEVWFATARLNVGYEALLHVVRQSRAPEARTAADDAAVAAVMETYVREGVTRLMRGGLLHPMTDAASCSRVAALRDALAVRATVARLSDYHGGQGEEGAEAGAALLREVSLLTTVLARRQHVRHVFAALFDRGLDQLCAVMLARGDDDALPGLCST